MKGLLDIVGQYIYLTLDKSVLLYIIIVYYLIKRTIFGSYVNVF